MSLHRNRSVWISSIAALLSATPMACGGGPMPKATAGAGAENRVNALPTVELTSNPTENIRKLSESIEQASLVLSLGELSSEPVAMSRPVAIPATCKQSQKPRCIDTCTLGTSICDNAIRICDLASTLPGDSWAEGKCTNANKRCTSATQRCCECGDS